MRTPTVLVPLIALVLLPACGGDGAEEQRTASPSAPEASEVTFPSAPEASEVTDVPSTTSSETEPSPTATPVTTPTSDAVAEACAAAMDVTIDATSTLLNRVDADPTVILDVEEDIPALFEDLGSTLAESCVDFNRAGPQVARFLAYLAEEQTQREGGSAAVVESMLAAGCSTFQDREIPTEGRVACIGY